MGESAGAASIQIHLQETNILGLARAAILESGGIQIPLFTPDATETVWDTWVSAIPGCASNKTIECIRDSNTESLIQAQVNLGVQIFFFDPVIDGPSGLIPGRWSQFPPKAHLPLLLGTNLEEGTIFVPQSTNSTEEIRADLLTCISPPLLSPTEVNEGIEDILNLYPDVPSLGSPFGTGNKTFGLNTQYKRNAAIFGDFVPISGRRIVAQTRSRNGDKVFVYLFTNHEATVIPEFVPAQFAPGSLGMPHTPEIPFIFGTLTNVSSQAMKLSVIMQDYWISFATTLDPNHWHGSQRPEWPQYTTNHQVVLKLDGSGITTIPDDFKREQLAFFADNPDLLHT